MRLMDVEEGCLRPTENEERQNEPQPHLNGSRRSKEVSRGHSCRQIDKADGTFCRVEGRGVLGIPLNDVPGSVQQGAMVTGGSDKAGLLDPGDGKRCCRSDTTESAPGEAPFDHSNEHLNGEIKRCTEGAGIPPPNGETIVLVGALVLEWGDEWGRSASQVYDAERRGLKASSASGEVPL